MNSPFFLLFGIEILGALLCVASTDYNMSGPIHAETGQPFPPTDPTSVASSLSATLEPITVSQDSNSHSTSLSHGPQSTTTSTTTTTTNNAPIDMFYKKECRPVFMTAGGLVIACTILLISTLLLMCKVCRLSSRIRMLSDNADLISTSEYLMGTAKKSKREPETDAKETIVLMADIGQTQRDVGNGAAKEEPAKANEDGQTGEEDKKEVGDTAKSEDASTTPVVENASQVVKARAAPSSKGTEEPKEEV